MDMTRTDRRPRRPSFAGCLWPLDRWNDLKSESRMCRAEVLPQGPNPIAIMCPFFVWGVRPFSSRLPTLPGSTRCLRIAAPSAGSGDFARKSPMTSCSACKPRREFPPDVPIGSRSFDPIGLKSEIHRQGAKRAKKYGDPAHQSLTMRLMPYIHCFFPSRSWRLRGDKVNRLNRHGHSALPRAGMPPYAARDAVVPARDGWVDQMSACDCHCCSPEFGLIHAIFP